MDLQEKIRTIKENPDKTLNELGKMLGMTRQGVHHLIKRHNLTRINNRRSILVKCFICNKDFYIQRYRYNNSKSKIFHCSKKCKQEYKQKYIYMKIPCYTCGGFFPIRRAYFNLRDRSNKKWFCSKNCYGKYIGDTYGFTRFWEKIKTKEEK